MGGNRFKLLTEDRNLNESLVASGVKKVFMNAGNTPITYHRIECVGMGYIKDITEAKKISLQEAREIANEYGYKDSEDEAKFVKDSANVLPLKEDGELDVGAIGDYENGRRPMVGTRRKHPETDMNNPEEKQEVQIGRQILAILDSPGMDRTMETEKGKLRQLAQELIKIHGQEPE